MYMVEDKENSAKGKNVSNELSSLTTEQALDSFQKALQQGHSDEIVQMFLESQARNLFPKGGDTLKWLTDNIGKKAVTKTVVAFASLACFDCKEGLRPCENCNGTGHFDYEMVCESCLGLASVPCDFCGSIGWASIDCIPVGLRLAVFGVRLESAEKQVESMFKKELLHLSEKNAVQVFKECVDLLFDLNKQISVLESTVGIARNMIEVPSNLKGQMSKITRKCVIIAVKGEKKLEEIIETMIAACKLQSESEEKNSKIQKFAAARTKFYSSLFNSRPRFSSTYLEHPLLNEAAKIVIPNKDSDTRTQDVN